MFSFGPAIVPPQRAQHGADEFWIPGAAVIPGPLGDGSAKPAGDKPLRARIAWGHEDLAYGAKFTHFAQIHKACIIRNPRGLLKVMSYDDDRMVALELIDCLLDFCRRNRIDGSSRLVEKKNLSQLWASLSLSARL